MILRVADVIQESIVDGPGIRYVVFVQGCPHNCKGCHNPQTHDFDGGAEMSIDEIVNDISKNPLLDGITLSGGEPFYQAKELAELAKMCHKLGLNVMTYTGYTYEQICQNNNPDWCSLLCESDFLMDGPFIEEQKTLEMGFRGSRNQRFINVKKTLSNVCGEIILAD